MVCIFGQINHHLNVLNQRIIDKNTFHLSIYRTYFINNIYRRQRPYFYGLLWFSTNKNLCITVYEKKKYSELWTQLKWTEFNECGINVYLPELHFLKFSFCNNITL
jgi:hypothetical protein